MKGRSGLSKVTKFSLFVIPYSVTGRYKILNNKWTHVVVTFDRNEKVEVYIDKEMRFSQTYNGRLAGGGDLIIGQVGLSEEYMF